VLWLIFSGGLAAWQGLVRERYFLAGCLGVAAIAVAAAGLVKPAAVRWIYVGWMLAGFPYRLDGGTAGLVDTLFRRLHPLAPGISAVRPRRTGVGL